MTLDSKSGVLFIPTGSAAFDFYGGDRLGDDVFANCLIALKAETGERVWHFQAVHHDLWDRDFPSPPVLITVDHDGKKIEAVAQTSKQGFVFLFDRSNGKPLFPLETRKYPASELPGESAAPEQALPTRPEPYARQLLTEDLLTDRTPDSAVQDGTDEALALRDALAGLAPRQRAVIVLRYYEDLTERETAELLGISVGTVKSQARDALARLRGPEPALHGG